MRATSYIRRTTAVALALIVVSGMAAGRKTRIFNAGFQPVWTAAVSAARDGFVLDKVSPEERSIRFRTGPLRAYRFEVTVADLGAGKTRVEVSVRTNSAEIERVASRDGDRYLLLLAQRLQARIGK